MNIKEHEEIIKNYNNGKARLYEEVSRQIGHIGTAETGRLINAKMSYVSDVKRKHKTITYEKLIEIAKKIFG